MRNLFTAFLLCFFTERFNQTLVTALSKLVNEEANDWDDHIDAVAFAYRTNVQASTKRTPFELLYGIHATLPAQLKDDHAVDLTWESSVDAIMQRADAIETLLPQKRKAAQENISSEQTKQKKRYDLKHSAPTFDVGDQVLKYNRRRQTRKGDKLEKRYQGPYVIAEVMAKGVYRLATLSGSPVKVMANSRDLKIYSSDGYASPQKSNAPKVDLTTATQATSPSKEDNIWVQSLNLHQSDRDVVRAGWLNDRVVDAINQLIAQELGVASQSTVLSQSTAGFDAVSTDTVMILHAQGHWITVAGSPNGVTYIDSLRPHQPLTQYVTKQLLELFRGLVDDDGKLRVSVVPSTPQNNSEDCGVFAAAYATELVCGKGPSGLQSPFDVTEMRKHLE